MTGARVAQPGRRRATCWSSVTAVGAADDLIDLFARDVDVDLLRRGSAKTPTERIVWLEEMQEFAEAARKARTDLGPLDPTADGLERAKPAAARPKDLVDLGSLRALRR